MLTCLKVPSFIEDFPEVYFQLFLIINLRKSTKAKEFHFTSTIFLLIFVHTVCYTLKSFPLKESSFDYIEN